MPKIVDHEQYRRQLLGKCFDLFADKGYAAVTMYEIAQGLIESISSTVELFFAAFSLNSC